MLTLAPSDASFCAIALPIPRVPPVTRATLPIRGFAKSAAFFALPVGFIRFLPRASHVSYATLILLLWVPPEISPPAGATRGCLGSHTVSRVQVGSMLVVG